jgi:uncharacterized membrane protein (DUF2068 family)
VTSPPATAPPGTEKPRRYRPKLRYELIGCGLHGHELVGTDAASVRPEDRLVVREHDGLRWHRCLRCDSWLPLPPPEHPARPLPPDRTQIDLPLRGRPLRDRYVLRLIAVDRVVHVLVLGTIAVVIFLFAHDRGQLHSDYTRILANLQGGLGGPIDNTGHGVFSELNRLFAFSPAELYLAGVAVTAYTAVLACEAFGLWFARRWAEYLTFVETGILVPLEIYELTTRVSALKVLALIINLAVVGYLLISKRLFGLRGGGAAERAERQADTGWQALERADPYLATEAGGQVVQEPAAAGPPASPAPPPPSAKSCTPPSTSSCSTGKTSASPPSG